MTLDETAAADPNRGAPSSDPSRNPWKIIAIVLGSLIAVFVILAILSSRSGDNRDEKLAEILPTSIEENFQNKGIDVEVESVSCDDLPTGDATFSIMCDVRVVGIDEVIETTVQGSVNDDFVQIDDVFSEERLLTPTKAVEYVQTLVAQMVDGVEVLDCDLGNDVVVVRPGSEFTCSLDSGETVLVSVSDDGSAQITDVFTVGES